MKHFFQFVKLNVELNKNYKNNMSLSLESVILINKLEEINYFRGENLTSSNKFSNNSLKKIFKLSGTKFLVTNEIKDKVWEENKDSVDYLNKNFKIFWERKRNSKEEEIDLQSRIERAEGLIDFFINNYTPKKELAVSLTQLLKKELSICKKLEKKFSNNSRSLANSILIIAPFNHLALSHSFIVAQEATDIKRVEFIGQKLIKHNLTSEVEKKEIEKILDLAIID